MNALQGSCPRRALNRDIPSEQGLKRSRFANVFSTPASQ